MLETIKELIRTPIVNKLNKEYEKELDKQFVSYDSWIRAKEEEYLNTLEDISLGNDIIVLVGGDGEVDENASRVLANAFKDPKVKLIYGDCDEYNSHHTVRMNPVFRPDYSPDTLLNYMYMGNVVAIRKSSYVDRGSIHDSVIATCQSLDRDEILHLDYVLYHDSFGVMREIGYPYVMGPINDNGVSIIIPSKDNPEILFTLLNSLIRLTRGIEYEVIVIDNGSSEENKAILENAFSKYNDSRVSYFTGIKYIYSPQDFNFSRICNEGVAHGSYPYYLFLNDDMEIRDSKWLYRMMSYATLPHVGAVGAKLYYPESKTIQHVGITNLRLGPVHKLQYKEDNHIYYDHVNDVDRDVIAVTGACLLVEASKFQEVGGFDSELQVAFNDVDLCFSLYEAGYYNVVVNTTHLWHYESLSRGDDESRDKLGRLQKERTLLYEKHPELYGEDPFYHDYLTKDILDSNYTYAFEYTYDKGGPIPVVNPKKLSGGYNEEWENPCLIISLEQCGTLEYFLGRRAVKENERSDIYIGGYSFIAGSDNSCFRFSLLLRGDSEIYELPCNRIYRPDLEINLDPEEKASLCGFSVKPNMKKLPRGSYQVGVIARGVAYNAVLARFTNRYISI